MTGTPPIDSSISSDELKKFEEEISRLETICKCTTLRYSDVKKILSNIHAQSYEIGELKASIVAIRRLWERVSDKAYLYGDSLASEVHSLAEDMLYEDLGKRELEYINRLEFLLGQIHNKIQKTGSISKDDPLSLELERLQVVKRFL